MPLSLTPGQPGGWNHGIATSQTTTVRTILSSASGLFGGYYVYNPNSSVAYLQVFDVSGTVTLGTTLPDMTFGIPASAAANLEISQGVPMTNAIKLACTTTSTGSSAPGTGLDVTIFYR